MHGFFTWHPAALLLCFALLGMCLFLFGAMALRRSMRQYEAHASTMPAVVLLSTIATTWSLLFGFTASDVWNNNTAASQAASAERSSLSRLMGMTQVTALNDAFLHQQLHTYRTSVAKLEWGEGLNQVPHPQVEQTLQAIRMGLLQRINSGSTSDIVMTRMVEDFDELQDARSERLAIGAANIDGYKWWFLLAFSFLVQSVVAAIHADRLKGGRKAVACYALMVALCLYVLALHVNPYVGAAKISPQILFTTQL